MRWTYVIPRLVIVALIWAFMAFGFDPLLRYSAIQSLQAVTGAKVDIASVRTGFFPPRFSIDRAAVASYRKPGVNMLQFDSMNFSLAGAPLLRKSYVVEEAAVTGVRFGTLRNDDGQLQGTLQSDAPETPSWLIQKLTEAGDDWLENFTEQAKGQLDPDTLESYRLGNQLYGKWDQRFTQMNGELDEKKQQAKSIRKKMEQARKAEPLQQVELYLQLAQQADVLMRETRSMRTQVQGIVPEVRHDFARLDQARKNDQQQVMQRIQLLKPDTRRITESLIGDQMYLQLHQILSWLQTARSYQEEFRKPAPPERQRGRDFEFSIFDPTPRMLCRKISISGELMVGSMPTPFEAVLTDVTSDPQLLGKPALLRATTVGESPFELIVQHDATKKITQTDLAAEYTDSAEQQLSAGTPDGDCLTARLSNMQWVARLTLVENQVQGQITVSSDFGSPEFRVKNELAAGLAGVVQQTLTGIHRMNASIRLDGPMLKPDVSVTSDLGEQVATGFETAYEEYLPQLQSLLVDKVSGYVEEQRQQLAMTFGGRHEQLLADNTRVLEGLGQIRQLAAALRSGKADPKAVFQTVSESGVLSTKDQQKADEVIQKTNNVLDGLDDPARAFQRALPGLRKKLFR
ncbi:MAG: TIGR03545 family protein [Fuerstiella sp.]|nr:TIGR03545 family protein [Fuerstiella sp.]MCP4511433.1 TIGR03545 family protein [Fuerstiella sp.]